MQFVTSLTMRSGCEVFWQKLLLGCVGHLFGLTCLVCNLSCFDFVFMIREICEFVCRRIISDMSLTSGRLVMILPNFVSRKSFGFRRGVETPLVNSFS